MTGPVYVVRMWHQRGRGAYVHKDAWLGPGPGYAIMDGTLSVKQRDARRFTLRCLAQCYADAFGGRVVRLRERGR